MADLDDIDTPEQLGARLDALRVRRGLSFRQLGMPKSTAADLVRGKAWEVANLRRFLTGCGVPTSAWDPWLTAFERTRTGSPPPATRDAVRVRDASPRRLGVHAAIQVSGVSGDLPPYVPRDLDDRLRAALDAGRFVLLVGGSSVGKTRTLYEALLARLPDWWLVHPETPEEVSRLAANPGRRTVVWLDELQRHLGPSGTGLTASTVRALLSAHAVLAGTLWPDEYTHRMARPADPNRDPYAEHRQLLGLADAFDVPSAFTPEERRRATEAAPGDERVRLALRDKDAGFTQILAAGPALVHWWEQAPPYARALITAGADARRLGVHSPLTEDLLRSAAPGYLTGPRQARAPKDWFESGLEYATAELHGAASALVPVAGGIGVTVGYTVADYLVQEAAVRRRTEAGPGSLWEALAAEVTDADDLRRAADSAEARMLYGCEIALLRRTPEGQERHRLAILLNRYGAGEEAIELLYEEVRRSGPRHWRTADDLAELLVEHDRVREAIDVLLTYENLDDEGRVETLTDLMLRIGDTDGALRVLRTAADEFYDYRAEEQLAEVLARRGEDHDVEELKQRAVNDRDAAEALARLHARRGDLASLRAMTDRQAAVHLAGLLAGHGTPDDIAELRSLADAGDTAASAYLARWLVRQGQDEEAVRRIKDAFAYGPDGDLVALLPRLLGDAGAVADVLRSLPVFFRRDAARGLAGQYLEEGRAGDALRVMAAAVESGERHSVWLFTRLHALHGDLDTVTESLLWLDNPRNGHWQPYRAHEGVREDGVHEGDWAGASCVTEALLDRDAFETVSTRIAEDGPRMADLLSRHGDLNRLRADAADGDGEAAGRLDELLARQDDLTELHARADAGDVHAARLEAAQLVRRGAPETAITTLRTRLLLGSEFSRMLADLLADRGELDDALRVLRAAVDAGEIGAPGNLIAFLDEHNLPTLPPRGLTPDPPP
ncbi:hypothetical protein [Streptomyces acidiscabies]|uniref:hypothetical protein n=1 Tax=Streptomyces acidiscabies TaxID=42234 RepID=UPI0038F7CA1B